MSPVCRLRLAPPAGPRPLDGAQVPPGGPCTEPPCSRPTTRLCLGPDRRGRGPGGVGNEETRASSLSPTRGGEPLLRAVHTRGGRPPRGTRCWQFLCRYRGAPSAAAGRGCRSAGLGARRGAEGQLRASATGSLSPRLPMPGGRGGGGGGLCGSLCPTRRLSPLQPLPGLPVHGPSCPQDGVGRPAAAGSGPRAFGLTPGLLARWPSAATDVTGDARRAPGALSRGWPPSPPTAALGPSLPPRSLPPQRRSEAVQGAELLGPRTRFETPTESSGRSGKSVQQRLRETRMEAGPCSQHPRRSPAPGRGGGFTAKPRSPHVEASARAPPCRAQPLRPPFCPVPPARALLWPPALTGSWSREHPRFSKQRPHTDPTFPDALGCHEPVTPSDPHIPRAVLSSGVGRGSLCLGGARGASVE